MRNFKIYELVSEKVYQKFGENSLKFFDIRLIETADVIRDILGVPLIINDWYWGGKNKQRGLRENTSQIVSSKTIANTMYLSGHPLGKAFDCVSSKMPAEEMRKKLKANAGKLPYNIRIESGKSAPTWLHVDLLCDNNQKSKIVEFIA